MERLFQLLFLLPPALLFLGLLAVFPFRACQLESQGRQLKLASVLAGFGVAALALSQPLMFVATRGRGISWVLLAEGLGLAAQIWLYAQLSQFRWETVSTPSGNSLAVKRLLQALKLTLAAQITSVMAVFAVISWLLSSFKGFG